jgi:hypothetical protein
VIVAGSLHYRKEDPQTCSGQHTERWTLHSCPSGQKGQRDQICIYRPYVAKPKRKDGGAIVSRHAFMIWAQPHPPAGSASARENRSTRRTHLWPLPPKIVVMMAIMIERTTNKTSKDPRNALLNLPTEVIVSCFLLVNVH